MSAQPPQPGASQPAAPQPAALRPAAPSADEPSPDERRPDERRSAERRSIERRSTGRRSADRRQADRRQAAARQAQRRFAVACVGAVGAVAAMAYVLTSVPLSLATEQAVGDGFMLVAAAAALLSCVRATRRSAGRLRVAWFLLSLNAFGWAAGNATWFYYRNVATEQPFPSVTDAFLVAAIVVGPLGLLFFPVGSRNMVERLRSLLDALVLGGSLLAASVLMVLTPILETVQGTWSGTAVLVIYPAGDIVFATLALMLLARAPAGRRMMLGLLCVGYLVYAVSDSAYAYAGTQNAYLVANQIQIGWFIGYVALALAAYAPNATVEVTDRSGVVHGSAVISALTVYGSLLVAVLASAAHPAPLSVPIFVSVGGFVLVLFGVRQLLVALENAGLNRNLEAMVKQRTAELERLSRQSERILESVADGLYGVDIDGRISLVNPAAAKLLGYADGELIGQPAHPLFHVAADEGLAESNPFEPCHLSRALRTGLVVRQHDAVYRRRDGTTFPVEATASPIVSDGRICGAVVAFRDVSARREVERMKNEFISVVSHELRTPLTSIRGSLGLLAGGALGGLPDAADRMVRIALQSSERLTRLINDMLDLERISSGAVPLDRADHAAADLVEQAVATLRPVADEAGVRLEVGTMDGFLHADGDRVVQTLINLAGNAIKFSPAAGRVLLTAERCEDAVLFTVADEGRGIPPDKLDTIFDRFQQVDSSDSREKGGTGLGLAICRGIVERHGGRIWVESTPGAGAIFRFTVPATTIVLPPADPDAAIRDDRPMVLVVDDDTGVLAMLGELLDRRGFRAVTVSRAEDALRVAAADRPAALIVDLRLPGMSGQELMAELRGDPATATIPVVVLSVISPAEDPQLARSVSAWVTKPSDEQTISAAVLGAVGASPRPANVLVVEDDDDLAAVMVSMLTRDGLEVRRAASEAAAAAMAQQHLPELLILDLDLPDGDGYGVVAALRNAGATIPVVVYSATEVDPPDRERLRLGPTQFLTKGRIAPEEVERRVVSLIGRLVVARPSEPAADDSHAPAAAPERMQAEVFSG